MGEMIKVEAFLTAQLEVICPHCQHEYDLLNIDGYEDYATPIFNNDWDELKEMEIECPKCEKEFQISEVIW